MTPVYVITPSGARTHLVDRWRPAGPVTYCGQFTAGMVQVMSTARRPWCTNCMYRAEERMRDHPDAHDIAAATR